MKKVMLAILLIVASWLAVASEDQATRSIGGDVGSLSRGKSSRWASALSLPGMTSPKFGVILRSQL